jgi:hypothetical protein
MPVKILDVRVNIGSFIKELEMRPMPVLLSDKIDSTGNAHLISNRNYRNYGKNIFFYAILGNKFWLLNV